MKRINNIYERIVDKDNIRYAIYQASKGNKKKPHVQYVLDNLEEHVNILYDMLVNHTYVPSPCKHFKRFDIGQQKYRDINAPRFFPTSVFIGV